jgi:hypothetical protein
VEPKLPPSTVTICEVGMPVVKAVARLMSIMAKSASTRSLLIKSSETMIAAAAIRRGRPVVRVCVHFLMVVFSLLTNGRCAVSSGVGWLEAGL